MINAFTDQFPQIAQGFTVDIIRMLKRMHMYGNLEINLRFKLKTSIRSDKDDTDIPLSWKKCSNMTTKIAQELIKTLKVLSSDLKEYYEATFDNTGKNEGW